MDTKKKKEQFIEVLKQNGGVISKACETINISRGTFYVWKETDAEFAEQYREVEEWMVDFVERKLMEQINDGDTTATIFYLKTKGKSRGYVEKVQLDGNFNNEVKITYVQSGAGFANKEDDVIVD